MRTDWPQRGDMIKKHRMFSNNKHEKELQLRQAIRASGMNIDNGVHMYTMCRKLSICWPRFSRISELNELINFFSSDFKTISTFNCV